MIKQMINFIKKKFNTILSTDSFQKTILIFGGWISAFTPVYVMCLIWWIVGPTTFVERFLVITLCLFTMSWIQVILIILAIKFTFYIIDEWDDY